MERGACGENIENKWTPKWGKVPHEIVEVRRTNPRHTFEGGKRAAFIHNNFNKRTTSSCLRRNQSSALPKIRKHQNPNERPPRPGMRKQRRLRRIKTRRSVRRSHFSKCFERRSPPTRTSKQSRCPSSRCSRRKRSMSSTTSSSRSLHVVG